MQHQRKKYSAFSIIEVLVGIFIFSMGLISVYAILVSSLSINERNKNTIIASNLAREQIELLRNIRDTNYQRLQVWNQQDPSGNGSSWDIFVAGEYYALENDFSGSWFSTKIRELGSSIPEWIGDLTAMADPTSGYKLCLDWENIYTYDCPSTIVAPFQDTPFYRYLKLEEVLDDTGAVIPNAYRVTSKVIWYKRGYFEFDIQTIITDWRRI